MEHWKNHSRRNHFARLGLPSWRGAKVVNFNDFVKDHMDTFVAVSMEDKWEDISDLLNTDLHETILRKRKEREIDIQKELEVIFPRPLAKMIRFFEAEQLTDFKIEDKALAQKPILKI